MKPHIHAMADVKRWGGQVSDYEEIHVLMDSSKSAFADNRHRIFCHNSWFVNHILPKIFGDTLINSDGKTVSVRDIGEHHCLDDFSGKFIPTVQDWLENLPYQPWMNNGRNGICPSAIKIFEGREQTLKEVLKNIQD